MNSQSYLSAVSALAGAIIGGVTSFATTWLTTTSQTRAARRAAERSKREDLYGRFMDELALLYASALNSETVDYVKLTTAFALRGRITLTSSKSVLESADRALKFVVDLSLGPRRNPEEMRGMMEDHRMDVISEFATACRQELHDLI